MMADLHTKHTPWYCHAGKRTRTLTKYLKRKDIVKEKVTNPIWSSKQDKIGGFVMFKTDYKTLHYSAKLQQFPEMAGRMLGLLSGCSHQTAKSRTNVSYAGARGQAAMDADLWLQAMGKEKLAP